MNRIKSYEFVDKGMFFELPKVLTLTDCVVRALFLKYDHLSEQSASFRPNIKRKEIGRKLTGLHRKYYGTATMNCQCLADFNAMYLSVSRSISKNILLRSPL